MNHHSSSHDEASQRRYSDLTGTDTTRTDVQLLQALHLGHHRHYRVTAGPQSSRQSQPAVWRSPELELSESAPPPARLSRSKRRRWPWDVLQLRLRHSDTIIGYIIYDSGLVMFISPRVIFVSALVIFVSV